MVNVKPMIGSAIKTVGEAIVKPVADEVGKALEQGVQSVVSGPQSQQPQFTQGQIEQKRADEQSKYTEAQRKIQFWKKLDEEQRGVRETQRQTVQAKQQETAKKQEVKQFEIVEKKKETVVQQAQARAAAEKRAGKGVGG